MSSDGASGRADCYMRDTDHARAMLSLAREDLNVLEAMRDPVEFPTRVFGFHAQQAVEKALKAWLALLGVRYPLTHALATLIASVEDSSGEPAEAFRDLDMLTPFAVQYRYEAYEGPFGELNRDWVIARVADLVDLVARLTSDD